MEIRIVDRTFFGAQCPNCKHVNLLEYSCPAFPDIIPIDVWNGTTKHDKLIDGQKEKIIFEQGEKW
jgi:hypothetical protein